MPKTYQIQRAQLVERSLEETFQFFSEAANLEAITPGFLNFRITTPQPIDIQAGTLIDYRLRLFGMPLKWRTLIEEFVPQEFFIDRQLKGPYRLWRHQHRFQTTDDGILVTDLVDYQLPLAFAGRVAHAMFVKRTLATIFDYRQQQIAELLGPAHTVDPSQLPASCFAH